MTLRDALDQLTRRHDLTQADAAAVLRIIMSGEATPAQTGALLAALRTKGETVDEIAGFAETMRAFATRVITRRTPLVDTCGTGGDRSGTFNISTTAAFVAAGAGAAVAKHGNRSATSKCGSADVLEHLGVNIDASPETVGKCLDEIGIGFLFARSLHGAMKHVGPIRAELGVRTVFNILGPLTNPAGADAQVMGVFDAALLEPIAEVLVRLGVRHAYVVAGADGLDEITLSASTHVAEARDGAVRTYEINPEHFGCESAPKEAVLGGDASENAGILVKVLEGQTGPRRDIVLMNAAAALAAAGVAHDLREGFGLAARAIDSGAALEKLEALKTLSHGN
ncbi:MAG: anthranilate phosphoribosyltransferase [Candidatus Hydrogenedens sp.]|nr:anthranilate phosphoribosyltransferase [Candidatus Hydrogenedens sp.]